MEFNIGDVVTLKSGGPTMTIEVLDNQDGRTRCFCVWFSGDERKRQVFYSTSLKLAEG